MTTVVEPDEQIGGQSGRPTWEEVRQGLQGLAEERGMWAGLPLPDSDLRLVVEPRHPYFDRLNGFRCGPEPYAEQPKAGDDGWTVVNEWHSKTRLRRVYVLHNQATGRREAVAIPDGLAGERLLMAMHTLGASRNWSLRAELAAAERLQELVTPQQYKYYILTGGFLETSKRSQVSYWFRKGRPTVALRPGPDGNMRILCCLCLHPLAFYEESFSGAMVPTDDLLSHLVMARADEHLFWRKANHHSVWDCRNGI